MCVSKSAGVKSMVTRATTRELIEVCLVNVVRAFLLSLLDS
jgi:hypothetical protein